jgi:hypothetical protein
MAVYDPMSVYQRRAISGGKRENQAAPKNWGNMPYMLVGNCVHKQNDDKTPGERIKCHPTREQALAHLRALYANVPEASMSEMANELGSQRWADFPYSKWLSSTPKKPYGNVTYADPGYQSDGKARYPLDSEDHCRAAWSYINMPKNASKYSSSQLAAIKGRIRAALKRYGAQISASE